MAVALSRSLARTGAGPAVRDQAREGEGRGGAQADRRRSLLPGAAGLRVSRKMSRSSRSSRSRSRSSSSSSSSSRVMVYSSSTVVRVVVDTVVVQ